MAEMDIEWFPFYLKKWLFGTGRLSRDAEFALFRLSLFAYESNTDTLHISDDKIAWMVKMTVEEWKVAKAELAESEKIDIIKNGIYMKKCGFFLQNIREKMEKDAKKREAQSKAGRATARSRFGKRVGKQVSKQEGEQGGEQVGMLSRVNTNSNRNSRLESVDSHSSHVDSEPRNKHAHASKNSLAKSNGHAPVSVCDVLDPEIVPEWVAQFERFYEMYPRHVGKKDAQRAWKAALKQDSADDIISGLAKHKLAWEGAGTEKRFIPYPATWLRACQWKDDPKEVAPPGEGSSLLETGRQLVAEIRERKARETQNGQ